MCVACLYHNCPDMSAVRMGGSNLLSHYIRMVRSDIDSCYSPGMLYLYLYDRYVTQGFL